MQRQFKLNVLLTQTFFDTNFKLHSQMQIQLEVVNKMQRNNYEKSVQHII